MNLPAQLGQLIPQGSPGLAVLLIDGQWLKLLLAIGRPSSRTITALLAQPIGSMSDEEIIRWLTEACAAKGIQPGTVLVANPSHLTTTRLFTLPSTDPSEIRDIVELQAEKHTPYAKEEILTDFKVLETDRVGYSRVLLVLSHQDIVHRALKIVEGTGWVLERVGFELEGLANWFQLSPHSAQDQVMLVAEIDHETTTLAMLRQDKPYLHRSVSIGAAHLLQDPEGAAAKLTTEFQRSLETVDAEGLNLPVAGIVLTGQADRIVGLGDRLQQALNLPAVVVPMFDQLAVAEGALPDQEPVSQMSFASLAGLALRSSQVDLTPKALKLHRAFEMRSRALVGLGCQLIGGLLLLSCLFIGKAHKHERYHASLVREQQERALAVQQLERSLRQMEFVKDWLGGREQFLDALTELSIHTPETIRWDSVSYTKDAQLVVKGTSGEMPKVFDFVAELRKLPHFTKVETRRVTNKKKGDRLVTEFEMVCSFEPLQPEAAPAEAGAPGG